MERLDKILAGTGRWSRREAKALIKAGRVQVDGLPARDEAQKLSENAQVRVDGQALCLARFTCLMMNKPAGLLSATQDANTPTVVDILPPQLRNIGLFPAGRLDKDTVGLLLLTNDGALAHRLLSPRSHVPKRYLAEVEGMLDAADVLAFEQGLVLGDGTRCLPAGLEILAEGNRCVVTVEEGKYHQVKRMLASRGKPVRFLKRISIGDLALDEDLAEGDWRNLTREELEMLRFCGKMT